MIKSLIIWGLLLWLAWRWIIPVLERVLLVTARHPQQPGPDQVGNSPAASSGPPGASAQSQEMVRCAHCGVFTLQSESIRSTNRFYCCQDHLRAASRTGPA